MRAPLTELTYRDTTAQAGMTYVYAVYAVDKAGNVSELSNQQEVTARELGIGELEN
jgi:fibronectin type 3 domain-containing protein